MQNDKIHHKTIVDRKLFLLATMFMRNLTQEAKYSAKFFARTAKFFSSFEPRYIYHRKISSKTRLYIDTYNKM